MIRRTSSLLLALTLLGFSLLIAPSAGSAQTPATDVVLVLPFENRSNHTEYNWIGESFADSLAVLLNKPGLIVVDGVGSSETGAQLTHMSSPGAVSTGTFTPGPDTFVVSEELSEVLAPGHDGMGWLADHSGDVVT